MNDVDDININNNIDCLACIANMAAGIPRSEGVMHGQDKMTHGMYRAQDDYGHETSVYSLCEFGMRDGYWTYRRGRLQMPRPYDGEGPLVLRVTDASGTLHARVKRDNKQESACGDRTTWPALSRRPVDCPTCLALLNNTKRDNA